MPIIEIYRVRVDPANVERLLEIHDEAVAEYQEHIPELLGTSSCASTRTRGWTSSAGARTVDPQRLETACGPTRRRGARADGRRARPRPRRAGPQQRKRMGGRTLEELARRAAAGDSQALSRLVEEVQHPVYRLALRFLGDPEDAKDASQEILIRLITHLGSFEGRSQFMTWAYSVAVRQLMRTRKRQLESSVKGAEMFAAHLDSGLADRDFTAEEAEYRLLSAEVRIGCTYGDAAVPLATAARLLPHRRRDGHAGHGRGRDLRDLPRGAPPARRPRAQDDAHHHRRPLRARSTPPTHAAAAARSRAASPPASWTATR